MQGKNNSHFWKLQLIKVSVPCSHEWKVCKSKCCVGVRACACACSQQCLTLCDPMDYSLWGYSVHRTCQERILEWAASSRGSSPSRVLTQVFCLLHCQADSLPLRHLGSPNAVCTPKVTKPHPHYLCENVSEYSLEKKMATHSNILAWKILRKTNLAGYSIRGSQRVGHK